MKEIIAGKRIVPNFFIVGAAKSGTTSLWQYLRGNKDVCMPKDELIKEPGFFSSRNKRTFDQYFALFDDKSRKLVGEASTLYLTDPTAALKIYQYNPEAKIIIILRNPADRAYSLYNWMVQEGYEWAGSFSKALKLEEKRKSKKIPNFFEPEYYWNYMYYRSGLYYEQVRRYVSLFKQKVIVIKFEDFKNEPSKIYNQVCSFLDIDENKILYKKHNVSNRIYSPKLQFFLRKLNSFVINFRKTFSNRKSISKKARDRLLKLGIRKGPRVEKINKDIRKKLLNDYQQDIIRLSEYLNKNFSSWQK